jgi:hypothetical protein
MAQISTSKLDMKVQNIYIKCLLKILTTNHVLKPKGGNVKNSLQKVAQSGTIFGLLMRLCHPPDGSTSPKYKLLFFIKTKKKLQREECTSF